MLRKLQQFLYFLIFILFIRTQQITTQECKGEEPSEFQTRFVSVICKKGDKSLPDRTGAVLKKNFILTAFDGPTEGIRCQIVKDDDNVPTGKYTRDIDEIFTFEDDFESDNWRVPQMQILKPKESGKSSNSPLNPMKLRTKYFLPKGQMCEVHTYDDGGKLIEIDVTVQSQEDCDDYYKGLNPINICIKLPDGCPCNKPQPGAGLECDDLLVGVINDDTKCVENGKPRLAADVNEVRRWIDRLIIQDNILTIKYLDAERDDGMYQCGASNQLKTTY
uniref:Peptidase S1 domain-containing protein n=1 Tax=Glossina pallidipes TaxID=7398 RepID=A0A1A9ZXM2_GLOPL